MVPLGSQAWVLEVVEGLQKSTFYIKSVDGELFLGGDVHDQILHDGGRCRGVGFLVVHSVDLRLTTADEAGLVLELEVVVPHNLEDPLHIHTAAFLLDVIVKGSSFSQAGELFKYGLFP